MKIKVINSFFDRRNDYILREAGQEFEVPKYRAEQLIGLGLVLPVQEKNPGDQFPMNPPEEAAGEENSADKPEKKPAARKKPKKTEEA